MPLKQAGATNVTFTDAGKLPWPDAQARLRRSASSANVSAWQTNLSVYG